MKKIPLTGKIGIGKFALVDDEDYEFLMKRKWNFQKKTGYAASGFNGDTILMHRIVNKTPKKLKTDHRDGERLNNQKYNLRNATNGQNCMNTKNYKNSFSKYKGVGRTANFKWRARIKINKKAIQIGTFESEREAAIKYNEAAVKYHGEFARLNDVA